MLLELNLEITRKEDLLVLMQKHLVMGGRDYVLSSVIWPSKTST